MIIKKVSDRVNNYLKTDANRQQLFMKRKDAFLDPIRLKFPVINPFTLKYDCSLIYLAYAHAGMWIGKGSKINTPEYYDLIQSKAKILLIENKCEYRNKKI